MHLYAGPKEGYYLQRAVKEMGGDPTRILERDKSHDMMADDGMFAILLRMCMDGWVDGILGGPNCRTRSTLRHQPQRMPGHSRTTTYPWGFHVTAKQKLPSVTLTMFFSTG